MWSITSSLVPTFYHWLFHIPSSQPFSLCLLARLSWLSSSMTNHSVLQVFFFFLLLKCFLAHRFYPSFYKSPSNTILLHCYDMQVCLEPDIVVNVISVQGIFSEYNRRFLMYLTDSICSPDKHQNYPRRTPTFSLIFQKNFKLNKSSNLFLSPRWIGTT